ncbi:MAG: PD40 domain-containing protein, partial [Clostridium sp.]|nr:PD40 domain-containing protein [Clostridium sp.]
MIQHIKNKVYIIKIALSLYAISMIGYVNAQSMPQIQGKLVYHTYESYDARDSKIYLFDFETKKLSCINDFIEGTYHTMNASFNLDGTKIVFMGITNQQGVEEWNIFIYKLASNELEQLTYNLRNEDPKFSPDGSKVVYKQGEWSSDLDKMIYSLCEIDLQTKEIKKITNDIVEKSMPYYSSDGESVYYMEGTGTQSRICSIKLDGSFEVTEIFSEENAQVYYPIIYHDNLYFTKFYSKDNLNDIIVKMDINSGEITVPIFNSEFSNSSDACPLSDELLVISSTKPGG